MAMLPRARQLVGSDILQKPPPAATHVTPQSRTDRQRLYAVLSDVDECAMVIDPAISKERSKQGKCVLRQHLIDKWFLSIERLGGAAAWTVPRIERFI